MRRQWIMIGQSFLKTIRTIWDKKCPSREGRNSKGQLDNGFIERPIRDEYSDSGIRHWV